MKIAISACLLGENCKYNGGNNRSSIVEDFIRGHEVLALCPEVLGGLPVPREPAEIVGGIVRTKDGTSVDDPFRKGAERALQMVLNNQIELVILQSRSPSCGVNMVYDGTFSGKLISGDGVFVQLLKSRGIRVMDAADIRAEAGA